MRTRTDVPGVDAPTGDTPRLEAALASGAQFLSTDYYVPDEVLGTTSSWTCPASPPPGATR